MFSASLAIRSTRRRARCRPIQVVAVRVRACRRASQCRRQGSAQRCRWRDDCRWAWRDRTADSRGRARPSVRPGSARATRRRNPHGRPSSATDRSSGRRRTPPCPRRCARRRGPRRRDPRRGRSRRSAATSAAPRAAGDRRRPMVDHGVEDPARAVVAGVARGEQHLASQRRTKILADRVADRRLAHDGSFSPSWCRTGSRACSPPAPPTRPSFRSAAVPLGLTPSVRRNAMRIVSVAAEATGVGDARRRGDVPSSSRRAASDPGALDEAPGRHARPRGRTRERSCAGSWRLGRAARRPTGARRVLEDPGLQVAERLALGELRRQLGAELRLAAGRA